MINGSFAFVALLLSASAASAGDEQAELRVRAAVTAMAPGGRIDAMQPAPIPGMYEVVVSGQVVYVTTDGNLLLHGSLWDTRTKRDLTDLRRAALRKAALAKISPEQRIIFRADEPKHTVTVFTDIDCGYCQRLHQQMADYNALGISVEYLFFPRAGLQSESFAKAVSVWCAADRNAALTRAKAGDAIDTKTCPNPVAEQFELGSRIGVSGTPMVVAEDGTQVGGYLDPRQLLARLQALTSTPR